MATREFYMQRCIELAKKGFGNVAPNPMVGSVLVHDNTIVGEGWHERYGEAHAEVNCVKDAIEKGNEHLLAGSTLYVSLEPCSHFGKTPPCTNLIIEKQIPRVVIGCRDPFPEVNGKGIERLKNAGVEVEEGIMEKECRDLNRRFFTFYRYKRPYIILKWAETAGKLFGSGTGDRLLISNELSQRLVHRWRAEEASILVGTTTALRDDPELTNRFWEGRSPVRLVVDMDLKLPPSLHLFDKTVLTIVFNAIRHEEEPGSHLHYYQVTKDVNLVHQICHALYQRNIQSVLVEGGAQLLQSFLDEGCWDEIRRITGGHAIVSSNTDRTIKAPQLPNGIKVTDLSLGSDRIEHFLNPSYLIS